MLRFTDPTRRPRAFQFSLRTLLVVISVLSAYLGAYTALLRPVDMVEESFGGMVVSGYHEPDFRIGGRVAKVVFSPAVCLDRAIRPSYWGRFSDFDTLPAERSQ